MFTVINCAGAKGPVFNFGFVFVVTTDFLKADNNRWDNVDNIVMQ